MKHFTAIEEQRAWSRTQRKAGRRIGFVPTMGALHDGHRSLMRAATADSDVVVVSIFVNPAQFDDPADLERYPRTQEQDLDLCAEEGVAALFMPEAGTMYPEGFATYVEVCGPLTDKLCAIARPGHFRGVCTVVAKLFHIVQPHLACFGQKDLQQLLIVNRMVHDLGFDLEIRPCPTVRDADGLALSSRNRRLSPAGRRKALALPRGMQKAWQAFQDGERSSMRLIGTLAEELLVHENVDLDYADVVRMRDFTEVETADEGSVLAAAAFVDGVRLIDNLAFTGPAIPVDVDAEE